MVTVNSPSGAIKFVIIYVNLEQKFGNSSRKQL